MNDNIQIVNKNGDIMTVEGISYIEIIPTQKKYLFYTLNEKVDNDLTKIYIAEVSENAGGGNPLTDAEWDDIRKKMVKISHKEELADIKYHNFVDANFHVGEAKKLAITAVAKQSFKDAQATHTISVNQTETPVVTGQSTFFQTDPVQETAPASTDNQANIFNNPPTPTTVDTSSVAPQAVAPTEQAPVAPATEVVTPAPPADTVVNQAEVVPPVPETPQTVETVTAEPQVTPVETTVNIEQKEIISDEDALKAIEVIQDYIAQEEAA